MEERERKKRLVAVRFLMQFFTFSLFHPHSNFQRLVRTYVDDDKKMIKNEKKNGRFLKAKSCMDKNDKW